MFYGGRVENLPYLPMDSTKKLPTVGVKNLGKKCRRLKWMVPNEADFGIKKTSSQA